MVLASLARPPTLERTASPPARGSAEGDRPSAAADLPVRRWTPARGPGQRRVENDLVWARPPVDRDGAEGCGCRAPHRRRVSGDGPVRPAQGALAALDVACAKSMARWMPERARHARVAPCGRDGRHAARCVRTQARGGRFHDGGASAQSRRRLSTERLLRTVQGAARRAGDAHGPANGRSGSRPCPSMPVSGRRLTRPRRLDGRPIF